MYQNLRCGLPEDSDLFVDSVHYLMIPEVDESALDDEVEVSIRRLQTVIEMGRKARELKGVKTKVRHTDTRTRVAKPDLSTIRHCIPMSLSIKETAFVSLSDGNPCS
jgi:hypothetical protein